MPRNNRYLYACSHQIRPYYGQLEKLQDLYLEEPLESSRTNIPVLEKTLAVMYSVPFDLNLNKSWWNVKLYSDRLEASKQTFEDMKRSNRVRGDNTWHTINLDSGVSVEGAMVSTGHSKLEIIVGIESNTSAAQ